MAESPPKSLNPLPRIRDNDWTVGVLLEHGPAKYRFEEENSLSYFVRIRTQENERGAQRRLDQAEQDARPIDGRGSTRAWSPDQGGIRTLWGADLKRAILQSKSSVQIGQVVAARMTRRERTHFESQAHLPLKDRKPEYRNRWEVERPHFVERQTQFARRMNETYQSARRDGIDGEEAFALYLIHEGTRRLSIERFSNPADQQAFQAQMRRTLEVDPRREAVIAKVVARVQANQAKRPQSPATPSRASEPTEPKRPREPLVRE